MCRPRSRTRRMRPRALSYSGRQLSLQGGKEKKTSGRHSNPSPLLSFFSSPLSPLLSSPLLSSGDILLNVNGVELTGVTRGEAVANLKNTSSPVVLCVLEMRPPDESCLEDMPPLLSPSSSVSPSSPGDAKMPPPPNDDYSPLWVSWLQLPR